MMMIEKKKKCKRRWCIAIDYTDKCGRENMKMHRHLQVRSSGCLLR